MPSIQSIIIRPEKKATPLRINHAIINAAGIEGDHAVQRERPRQVTLIAYDQLAEMASTIGFYGDVHIACRRNIMVDTLPKTNLAGKKIGLGKEVILEIIKYCTPCHRMEENFGKGAIDALSEKAGWVARVISKGQISVGDEINFL
jgi:MOSC domain-containing protein YiiM